jgi:hypothetical protein
LYSYGAPVFPIHYEVRKFGIFLVEFLAVLLVPLMAGMSPFQVR